MNKEKILEYYYSHKGEVIGGTVGLAFALSVLFLGVLKMLFVLVCIYGGYYLGREIFKDKDFLKNFIGKIKKTLNI